MQKISESFLHFLWKNQSLTGISVINEDEQNIEILDPGEHNMDAGPDFFNAKIRIDGTIWAGNIEIHINASDWMKHRHQEDPAYDSVILHVVYFNDCVITRPDNQPIPAALIRFPNILWDNYAGLMKCDSWIPCENNLQEITPVLHAQWISRIMVEKLSTKHDALKRDFSKTSSHMDDLLSRLIFRCFGLPVNTLPFEMMASALPYTTILRTKGDLMQLEALLFGASGMLHTVLPNDIYMQELKRESAKYGSLFSGHEIPEHIWKYLRMRPSSFPTIRVAQLAAFIYKTYPLSEKLFKTPSIKVLHELFRVRASDYWNTHYLFGKESKRSIKHTGQDFSHRLVINGIVPFMFFYGKTINDQQYCEYAIALLEQLPGERNSILEKWRKFGLKANNALESQGLLYLFKNYCKHKGCLTCQFGNYLIIHGKKT